MDVDRKTLIRRDLEDAQRELLAVLDGVGPEDWTRPTPNEGWTIHDILTHLTTSETGFVPTLRRICAGEGGVPSDFDPNRWNAGQLRRRGAVAPAELRAELERSHADMLVVLEPLDDAALDQTGHMSDGRDGTAEDNFRLVASHKRAHTSDIRAALDASTVA